MHIPFVDLRAQFENHKDEITSAITSVIEQTAFIRGPYVKKFEEEFARVYGSKHCIGVANGTDALFIVMKMLGIGPGDEVITTAHSWISTSETISQTGATPIFVEVDDYYTIDTSLIEKHITSRTKAILPVHLYGQMAEVDIIKSICDRYGLFLIEDCAQAHFSEYKGKRAGRWGIASTFSFFPGKNLGAYGDAGCIITDHDELALKCRMFANHGSLVKHQHQIEGINSRLDGLQAAILSVKLKYIIEWTKLRNEKAKIYNKLLMGSPSIQTPIVRKNSVHSFHLYVIQLKNRDLVKDLLLKEGIETYIHYPTPLPLLPAYNRLKLNKNNYIKSLTNSKQILSLPLYPEISNDQINYVVDTLKLHENSYKSF